MSFLDRDALHARADQEVARLDVTSEKHRHRVSNIVHHQIDLALDHAAERTS